MMKSVRPSFWPDLLAVGTLAFFSLGLGLWARKPCHEKPGAISPRGIQHPSFSLKEFQNYLKTPGAVVLDARDRAIYRAGHVPGAISLPVAEFDAAYEELKDVLGPRRENVVVVYCSDMWCGQAEMLQQKLIRHGFVHVASFPDGWNAWRDAGLPVEKSP
jgi:rhodanese-related sulfurtransferase